MTLFGIIPVRPVDLLEIVVVGYLLYRLYKSMRGTPAVSIFVGLLAVLLVQELAGYSGMKILQALSESLSDIYLLAAIIIFQPELRRVLLLVSRAPLLRKFIARGSRPELVTEVVEAVRKLSETKTGALIAIKRLNDLRTYADRGERIDALTGRDLILALFYSRNPLHDGALILSSNRIEAARCILPVTRNLDLSPELGLRHRGAVGLTEKTDAYVIVVSEETGQVSVAEYGEIKPIQARELYQQLADALDKDMDAEAPE